MVLTSESRVDSDAPMVRSMPHSCDRLQIGCDASPMSFGIGIYEHGLTQAGFRCLTFFVHITFFEES